MYSFSKIQFDSQFFLDFYLNNVANKHEDNINPVQWTSLLRKTNQISKKKTERKRVKLSLMCETRIERRKDRFWLSFVAHQI